MKNLLLTALLSGCAFALFAQATIKGQVLNEQHEPLAYVNILLNAPDSSFRACLVGSD